MASNINTGIIDTTYPVAGQDNDSQGFRDNFTNTNANFEVAKDEIEELQDASILGFAGVGLRATAPTASIGDTTDVQGLMAFDASYIYLCTADYDGINPIWIRASASTW